MRDTRRESRYANCGETGRVACPLDCHRARSLGAALAPRRCQRLRVAELDRDHVSDEVQRPAHWGGYRLVPDTYEFWQHREDRLHDRLRYLRTDGAWAIERLSP